MEQRQRDDGPAPVPEPAAEAARSVLDQIEAPIPEANVMLASGRRYELTAGTEADRVTIRSRTGEVVLRIEVTDAGPVLSFSGASVELVAARSLRLAAEDVSIEAGKDLSVSAGGSLRERVAGDHHLSVAGDERVEAANVELQANAGGVGVRAAQTIALDGEHIGLNDDPAPTPFAWSGIAEP
jgi:hypothetical protein